MSLMDIRLPVFRTAQNQSARRTLPADAAPTRRPASAGAHADARPGCHAPSNNNQKTGSLKPDALHLIMQSALPRAMHSVHMPAEPQPTPPSCERTPASPDDPGLHPPSKPVTAGPNGFKLGINGPDPLLAVGGTHEQQESQRDALLALSVRAAGSYGTRGTQLRIPSDTDVKDLLARLDPNPPIGKDGKEVTHAVYQSHIPNATPEQALDHVLSNPNEVFNAGGMEIRPPTQKLQDGSRYMLEVGGPPPTWLPIQVSVDREKNAFTIQTLDGHVLRGEQTFTFTSDCNGGTTLTQDARFQASTQLVGDAQQFAPIAQSQHDAWNAAHREIYEQFNGDKDYKGMGLGAPSAKKWAQTIRDAALHPFAIKDVAGEVANEAVDEAGRLRGGAIKVAGGAASKVVSFTGDVANFTIDGAGSVADLVLDSWGIPGGDQIEKAADAAGDMAEKGCDGMASAISNGSKKAGNVVSQTADRIGDFISDHIL